MGTSIGGTNLSVTGEESQNEENDISLNDTENILLVVEENDATCKIMEAEEFNFSEFHVLQKDKCLKNTMFDEDCSHSDPETVNDENKYILSNKKYVIEVNKSYFEEIQAINTIRCDSGLSLALDVIEKSSREYFVLVDTNSEESRLKKEFSFLLDEEQWLKDTGLCGFLSLDLIKYIEKVLVWGENVAGSEKGPEGSSLKCNDRLNSISDDNTNLNPTPHFVFEDMKSSAVCLHSNDAGLNCLSMNNLFQTRDVTISNGSLAEVVWLHSHSDYHLSAVSQVKNPGNPHRDKQLLEEDLLLSEKNHESFLDTSPYLGVRVRRRPVKHPEPCRDSVLFNVISSPISIETNPFRFMNYEVFRVVSFPLSLFPPEDDVWVMKLAKLGFFFSALESLAQCFDCKSKFTGDKNSPLTHAHFSYCRRHEENKPLHTYMNSISQERLFEYITEHQSLTPFQNEQDKTQAIIYYRTGDSSQSAEVQLLHPPTPLNTVSPSDTDLSEHEREDFRPDSSLSSRSTIADSGHGTYSESAESSIYTPRGIMQKEILYERFQIVTSLSRFSSRDIVKPIFYEPAEAEEGAAVAVATTNLDLNNACYPQFSSAAVRKQTFAAWNPSHSHRPDDLVAAGFFYAGYADCVRCFYCGLGLKFWRQADVPCYQHARYRSNCAYNLIIKGQEYVESVQRQIQEEQRPRPSTNTSAGDEPHQPSQVPSQAEQTRQPSDEPHERAQVVSTEPDLTSEAAQEALRNGYSSQQIRQAITHIVDVLAQETYETEFLMDVLNNLNLGDNSTPDTPTVNSTPDTPTVNSTPDTHTVGDSSGHLDSAGGSVEITSAPSPPALTVADNSRNDDGRDGAVGTTLEEISSSPVDPEELFKSVEREHVLLTERVTCRVCHTKPIGCIFLPCGHVIACQDCADIATHCLLCKTRILGTANIFLA